MSEQLIQDIHDRVAAMNADVTGLKEQISGDSLRTMIQNIVSDLATDDAWVRKMRFGKSDPALVGTKYARWNMSVSDIEFLYDLRRSLTGQKRIDGEGVYGEPSEELTRTFNALSDAHYLSQDEVRRIDGQAIEGMFPRINKRNIRAYEAAMRAMDTAESGFGSQLIGAQYVGDLWEAARPVNRVFNLINTFEMTAPTTYLPVEVDVPEMLLVSESTASNSSNYTTSKTGSNRVSATASKFVIHQMWSGEMEEDSIIPFIPFLRMQLAKSLGLYTDSLILNGDTTNAGTGNINLDDADPADTKHYLAFDGLRHAFLVDATGQGTSVAGAITYNTLRDLRGLMVDTTYLHDWGHPTDPTDLVFVADVATADRIAGLDEVISSKIQRSRALLNGEVADVLGHPVIGSIMMSKTEADGKVSTTANNNVKGQVVAFNRRASVAGWRRRVKLETERIPATDQTRLVASLRMAYTRYTPTGAASGIKSVAGAYNITL